MLDSCSLIGRKPGRSSGMVAQHSRITWVHRIRIDKVNRKGCPNIEIYKILLALGRTSYTLTGQLPGWERIWPRCTLSTTSGFFALFCKSYCWLFMVGHGLVRHSRLHSRWQKKLYMIYCSTFRTASPHRWTPPNRAPRTPKRHSWTKTGWSSKPELNLMKPLSPKYELRINNYLRRAPFDRKLCTAVTCVLVVYHIPSKRENQCTNWWQQDTLQAQNLPLWPHFQPPRDNFLQQDLCGCSCGAQDRPCPGTPGRGNSNNTGWKGSFLHL